MTDEEEVIYDNVLKFDQMTQYVNDIELPESMEFCGEKVPLDRFYVR